MNISEAIVGHIPFLRRYARILTGTQAAGDAYVAAALETLLEDPELFSVDLGARVALFRVFHDVWKTSPVAVAPADDVLTGFETAAGDRLMSLTPDHRQALLLVSLEGFTSTETAQILRKDAGYVDGLLETARNEIAAERAVDVLIIEDEPIISLDLQAIVSEMGHNVVGIATTRTEAVDLARKSPPDLVLADIQLADGSSGIDAVKDILADITAPVIFITAFPERLLTGQRPEPTFLISKPFREETVKTTISQALFLANDLKKQQG